MSAFSVIGIVALVTVALGVPPANLKSLFFAGLVVAAIAAILGGRP